MKLKCGHWYCNGRESRELIMGRVPSNPKWVWTLQGNWYDKATGQQIIGDPMTGQYEPLPDLCLSTMEKEVPTPEGFMGVDKGFDKEFEE
jgi:hypothetical protein